MITLKQLIQFVSPKGQQALIDFVKRAKDERGAGWLDEMKIEFPTFCWIVDLVCNKEFNQAYKELQNLFPRVPLRPLRSKLETLHTNLKFEIERKR